MELLMATLLVVLALRELRREMALPTESVPGGLLVAGLLIRMLVLCLVFVLAAFWLAAVSGRL